MGDSVTKTPKVDTLPAIGDGTPPLFLCLRVSRELHTFPYGGSLGFAFQSDLTMRYTYLRDWRGGLLLR